MLGHAIRSLGTVTVVAGVTAVALSGTAQAAPYGGEAGGNTSGLGGLIVINPQGSDSLIEIDRTANINLSLITIGNPSAGSDHDGDEAE
ncbi:hypothetical protein BC739_002672 [Kutzneria viridogrisea]|nr:hypothetical protein [Kutzneria albida]MBA8925473.1 hypothetical protein [Kutzneria viridogrisea]